MRQGADLKRWLQMDLGELLRKVRETGLRADTSGLWTRLENVSTWPLPLRLLVLFVALLATALLGGAWLTEGARLDRLQLLQETSLLQVRYVQYQERIAALSETESQISALRVQFGEFLDMAPGSLELVHVLKQVSQASREAGLHLEVFKPLAEERHPYYVILPVDIRLKGDFHGIGHFMELISRMKHLITVDVQLASLPPPGGGVVLTSRLRAYRYFPLTDGDGSVAAQ